MSWQTERWLSSRISNMGDVIMAVNPEFGIEKSRFRSLPSSSCDSRVHSLPANVIIFFSLATDASNLWISSTTFVPSTSAIICSSIRNRCRFAADMQLPFSSTYLQMNETMSATRTKASKFVLLLEELFQFRSHHEQMIEANQFLGIENLLTSD